MPIVRLRHSTTRFRVSDHASMLIAYSSLMKAQGLDLDQQALRRKNEELALALKEKNKKLMQTQELYDKLKRRAMMGQMQHAAENAVDSDLQSFDIRENVGQRLSRGADGPTHGLHEDMGPAFAPSRNTRISHENGGTADPTRPFTHREARPQAWDQVGGAGGKYPSAIDDVTYLYQ